MVTKGNLATPDISNLAGTLTDSFVRLQAANNSLALLMNGIGALTGAMAAGVVGYLICSSGKEPAGVRTE